MCMQPFKDGVPCSHPGCASHVTHPCEGCGRIGARTPEKLLVMRVAESTNGRAVAVLSLEEMVAAFKEQSKQIRKAYTKPPMSDACEFVALAYDEARAVFERALHDLEMAERISRENTDAL